MAGWSDWWLVPIVFVGMCALSLLWTYATAPGFDVRGKHVLISGATKGVGLAIAKKYAAAGARLSLVGRSMERLERARAEIKQSLSHSNSSSSSDAAAGAAVFLAVCDVSDYAQVARAVTDANAFHSRATDHVVHTAVTATPGFAWLQDLAQIRRDTGASYFGAVNLFHCAAPAMIASGVRGGVFVIVSTADALARPIGSSAFSGSLEALRGLAESLRNDLLPFGIAVSMFYPGTVTRSARIGTALPSMATAGASTAQEPPQTPVAGSDDVGVDFSALVDELGSVARLDADAAAQSLVDGLRAGYFLITNSVSGFCLRVASAGYTPRKMVLAECVLAFVLAPYLEAVRWTRDRQSQRLAAAVASR